MTNTFAGAKLDRLGERRTDDDWIAAQIADPDSRALVVTKEGPILEAGRPALVPVDGLVEPIFLGQQNGRSLFAVAAADDAPGEAVNLRAAAALVSHADAGLLAYATAMITWHRRHQFCANCGTKTDIGEAGFVRNCPNCGAQHHPRTDPVVIMLVRDEANDRVLLGRNANWPERRYSCLAGFVEPGESLEEAVAREVAEETDVTVGAPLFRSSQPWPFPASLMIGFHVPYVSGEPHTLDGELEDARWFTRDDLSEDKRDFRLPPPAAIARRLIDEWLES